MTKRLFDGFLLLVAALFFYQALHTKPENYDVMGPALWPMSVAVISAITVAFAMITPGADGENERKLNARFWLFISVIFGCVVTLNLEISPFFIPSSALCLLSYLLLSKKHDLVSITVAATLALAFCYTLQWIFTTFVNLDLTTSFHLP